VSVDAEAPQQRRLGFFTLLLLDVRQKPHEPRSLNCLFHHALLFCGEATFATVHHAAVRVDEILQEVDVFVIDVLDIVLREYIVCCHVLEILSERSELRSS